MAFDFSSLDAEKQIQLALDGFKILIATVSGFLAAFASEPIKNFFTDKRRRKALKIGLYQEILIFVDSVELYVEESNKGKSIVPIDALPPETYVYDSAMKEPLLFYSLKEAITLKQIYIDIKQLIIVSKENKLSEEQAIRFCEAFLRRTYSLMGNRRVSQKIVRQARKKLSAS